MIWLKKIFENPRCKYARLLLYNTILPFSEIALFLGNGLSLGNSTINKTISDE